MKELNALISRGIDYHSLLLFMDIYLPISIRFVCVFPLLPLLLITITQALVMVLFLPRHHLRIPIRDLIPHLVAMVATEVAKLRIKLRRNDISRIGRRGDRRGMGGWSSLWVICA